MRGRIALVGGVIVALASAWFLRFARGPEAGARGAERESSARAAAEVRREPALELARTAAEELETASAPSVGARTEVPAASASWLLGTLVDPEGRPIAGALVTLHDGPLYDRSRPGPPRVRGTVVSADDGRFRLAAPAREGRFGVSVTAAGFAARSRDQSPGVDVPFELVPVVRAHGRILGEGAARARVFRLADGEAPERVDDGGGRWSAEGLALGRATRFELVPEDAAPCPFVLEPSEPGELVLDLELGPRRELRGEVVDLLTRRPIPGAVLRSESELAEGRLAESDADGAFTLASRVCTSLASSERDVFILLAIAPGYLVRSVTLAELARTGVIELVPGGTLEGRVVDGDGRAVPGARLAWRGPLYLPDARFGLLCVQELAPVHSAEDGSFRLTGVPCAVEASTLEVQHGSTQFFLHEVAPERPAEPRVLEIRLGRGRTLSGQLVWEGTELLPRSDLAARLAGEPYLSPPAGQSVVLRCADGERSTVSDARGAFRFEELPAGSLSVACGPGSAPRWVPVQPAEARAGASESGAARDSLESVILPVPLPRRTVRGFLREPDGRASVGVELAVRLERRARPGEGVPHLTRTDEDGAFALEVPDLAFLEARLALVRGALELWHTRAAPVVDWSLPELAPVELAGLPADEHLWLSWEGPGADEGGRVPSRLHTESGRLDLSLPVGELVLTLRRGDGPRQEQRITVRAASAAQRIELAP